MIIIIAGVIFVLVTFIEHLMQNAEEVKTIWKMKNISK